MKVYQVYKYWTNWDGWNIAEPFLVKSFVDKTKANKYAVEQNSEAPERVHYSVREVEVEL